MYFPLGGSKGGEVKAARNIMIVWLASGLWHGAAWTYIAWGVYYGVWLIVERYVSRNIYPERWLGTRLSTVLGCFWAIAIFTIGEIIFRAPTFGACTGHVPELWQLRAVVVRYVQGSGLAELRACHALRVNVRALHRGLSHRPSAGTARPALVAVPRLPTVAGVGLCYYLLLFGVMGRIEFIYFQF